MNRLTNENKMHIAREIIQKILKITMLETVRRKIHHPM